MARIVLVAEESGTAVIRNRWTTSILINGASKVANTSTSVTVNSGDQIIIEESIAGSTFKNWHSSARSTPLVGTVKCRCIEFPPLSAFMASAESAPDYFFSHFNRQGSLTSLPEGSFDTSGITSVGDSFFQDFNREGSLTSLPLSFSLPSTNLGNPGYFCSGAFLGIEKGDSPLHFATTTLYEEEDWETGEIYISDPVFSNGDNYPKPIRPLAGDTVYINADVPEWSKKLTAGKQLKRFWNKVKELIPKPASALPSAPGTPAVGTSAKYAREDHVHRIIADEESISIQDEVITAMLLTDDDIRAICK